MDKSQADIENELREMGEAVAVIARTALAELHEAGLFPLTPQWARARALHEARELVETRISFDEGDLPAMVEHLTERWAFYIEFGAWPEGSAG